MDRYLGTVAIIVAYFLDVLCTSLYHRVTLWQRKWGIQTKLFLYPLRNCFAVLQTHQHFPVSFRVHRLSRFLRVGFRRGEGQQPPHLPHHDTLGCLCSPPHPDSQPYQSFPQLAALPGSAPTPRIVLSNSKYGGLSTRLLHCDGQPGWDHCPRCALCNPRLTATHLGGVTLDAQVN